MMIMRPASAAVVLRPESHEAVRKVAADRLRRARAVGVFPTPIDQLVAAGGVREVKSIDADCASFIKKAAAHVQAAFASALAKIRGFADLVGGRTFTAPNATEVQKRWIRLHELGHQVIPWQNLRPGYIDDAFSLSPECEEIFDREANDFASEMLFQGERFPPLAKHAGQLPSLGAREAECLAHAPPIEPNRGPLQCKINWRLRRSSSFSLGWHAPIRGHC